MYSDVKYYVEKTNASMKYTSTSLSSGFEGLNDVAKYNTRKVVVYLTTLCQ
jgi:hypothetical protein